MSLAFDIETLGLLPRSSDNEELPEITCVCLYSSEGGGRAFRLWGVSPDERNEAVATIVGLMDRARWLIGYNALRFDLEFMRRAWNLDDERMLCWVLKCIDPLVYAQRVVGQSCKLQHMLDLNGLGAKTASGGDAIRMARDGEWAPLLEYCLADARLVYELVMDREWTRLTACVEGQLRPPGPPRFRLVPAPETRSVFFGTAAAVLTLAPY